MSRSHAILVVLLGAMFMSFAGVTLRNIENASSVQVLVYRSIALACLLPVIAMIKRRVNLVAFLRSLSGEDVFLGVFMGASFSAYVYSILNTTVASTLFILSAAPFLTALLSWAWIGEKPRPITWFAMLLALAGVAVMVLDGLGDGRLFGNLMALSAATSFSICLVFTRRTGKEDMLGGTFLGGLFASGFNAVLAVMLGQGLVVGYVDAAISLGSGVFTIGIGMALVIWAASHLPAAEVSILTLFEGVLGPIWVYLFIGEQITKATFVGGLIVLVSILIQSWFSRPSRLKDRAFRYGPVGQETEAE